MNGKQCVFPFKYQDVIYHNCTTVKNNNVPWCSTKTDEKGNYITGQFGNCSQSCLGNFELFQIVNSIINV